MREPSIHITRVNLVKLLKTYIDQDESNEVNWPGDYENLVECLADFLLKNGSRYQLTLRKRLACAGMTPTALKKVEMASRSYKADAQLFSKVLVSLRKSKKHKGINIIKEGNKEWNIIKEVTALATGFCRDFELPLKEGYIEYIDTAMIVLPAFSLNRLNFKHDEICKTYEAIGEIRSDPNKDITEELYESYYQVISSKTGITNDYKKRPLKFVSFVRAAEIVKEIGVNPRDYVNAQFKSLEWINGLPDPVQLTGDSAIERLQKHMYSARKKVKRSRDDLRKIMLGHDSNYS